MSAPPRVLLSAYQCGSGMGSVSQIGWMWYRLLAERLPVTLVTHVRNQQAMNKAGAPIGDSEVIYIDTEWFAKPLYSVMNRLFPSSQHAVFLFSSLDYFVYDREALRQLAQRRNSGQRWDLVHIPTPVSPSAATLLHRIGLPLVLGPWNGGLASPKHFPEIMKADAGWLYPIRNVGRLINAWRHSTEKASRILVANKSTLEAVPARDRLRCRTMIENAVDIDVFKPAPYPAAPSADQPLRVAFVGRLVPFKGVSMLLEAAERFSVSHPIAVTIVGDGPLDADLRAEVAARGLASSVTFRGAMTQREVAEEVGRAHLFCLPSVRESGGAVVLEAMACARPVAAVAYGGPAELVDETVGRALPPDGREAVVQGLQAAFQDLVNSPDDWKARGLRGHQRVLERYTWSAKINEALHIYGELSP